MCLVLYERLLLLLKEYFIQKIEKCKDFIRHPNIITLTIYNIRFYCIFILILQYKIALYISFHFA